MRALALCVTIVAVQSSFCFAQANAKAHDLHPELLSLKLHILNL